MSDRMWRGWLLFRRRTAVKAMAVLGSAALILTGCGSGAHPQAERAPRGKTPTSTSHPPTPTTTPRKTQKPPPVTVTPTTGGTTVHENPGGSSPPPVATAPTLSKPAIPGSGAYLGAWVDAEGQASASEPQYGPASSDALASSMSKALGITNNFIAWNQSVPIATLQFEAAFGTIPMVDWHCGDLDTSVASGADDILIRNVAEELKAVGKPVFLRWYWEMNFTTDPQTQSQCLGSGGPAAYVAAWQHIWNIFQFVGATNVAFVWCPGGNNISTVAPQFYPGNGFVDWIATDVYAVSAGSSFADLATSFYNQFAAYGKPLMIAETGAQQAVQAQFLQGVADTLPTQFPAIKAFVYFDGSGPRGDWSLAPAGLAEFRALRYSSYFSP